jgi:HAE1 family hydrophobic/amphiphilic exporter-1
MIWVFDFTLNTMTLLGLTLAIGVVIDDAIIVLENIERPPRAGKERARGRASRARARSRSRRWRATFSVAAVFLPVAFGSGRMGAFLREFGITVSVAVMVSLFVALTLTPMLAGAHAAAEAARPRQHLPPARALVPRLETGYRNVLDWTLAHRGKTALIAVASVVVAIVAGKQLPGEFFPSSDSGFVLLQFRTPPGTSLEATEAILVQNQQWLLAQPETAAVFGRIGSDIIRISGPNQGMVNARLVPREQRSAARRRSCARRARRWRRSRARRSRSPTR